MFLSLEMDRLHRKPTHTGRYPTVLSLQQSRVPHDSYNHDPRTAEPVRITPDAIFGFVGALPKVHRFISQHFRGNVSRKMRCSFLFLCFVVRAFVRSSKHTRTPYPSGTRTVLTNEALPWECVRSRESDRKEICSGRQIRDSLRMCWPQHRYVDHCVN
jgi:hypothetical protein